VTTPASDERGMVGKLLIVWLIVLALIGVAAIDAVSVVMAQFQLSDAATRAATSAAAALNRGEGSAQACEVAADELDEHEPDATRPKRSWCDVDETDGTVTIRLRTEAGTLVAGRLSFTKDLTVVTVEESAGRSAL
jgi:Tfp pilus assembly protein PilX